MKKKERQELRTEAQRKLFFAMQTAFKCDMDEESPLWKEMDKQMKIIERRLGWEAGSWKRGC